MEIKNYMVWFNCLQLTLIMNFTITIPHIYKEENYCADKIVS